MGKYIVELKKNETLYKATTRGGTAYVCAVIGTPYEPNLEQVRKEAYENGYKDANAKISSNEQAIAEKAYEEGLSDAWEAARKLMLETNYGGLTKYEIEEIFGADEEQTMINYSASEVIEEIRAYEQVQKEINVWDEVATDAGNRATVLYENPDGTQVFVFKSDGTAAWWTKSALQHG